MMLKSKKMKKKREDMCHGRDSSSDSAIAVIVRNFP
jgi:hypothetical protein